MRFKLTLIVASIAGAGAFSAHLSRPWSAENPLQPKKSSDTPLSGQALHHRRRNVEKKGITEKIVRGLTIALSAATTIGDSIKAIRGEEEEDEEELLILEEEELESMKLEGEEEPLILAVSSSGGTANRTDITPASAVEPGPRLNPNVWNSWKPLLGMCRPSNFIGVVVFHMLGTQLALQQIPNVAFTARLLFATLIQPGMLVVLTALLLTSSTSMVVNDYYDTKSGVDASKHYKPLLNGEVPMQVAKNFLSTLYATLLVCVAVIPGIPARLSVVVGMMLTFWYTKHLKPITWLKNAVCASLIALSPLTSGAATMQLVSGEQWRIVGVGKIWRLVTMLFFGFMGREIMMDCNDVVDDRLHKVYTVPVVYGRKFATWVSVGCVVLMSILSLFGTSSVQQIAFAGAGSLAMIYRSIQVLLTEGNDADVLSRAIEEGKSTVMLLLASFFI